MSKTRLTQKKIAQAMRERIVSGQWTASGRIPTKMDLCRFFGTSNMTMQKAMTALMREGFLVARGRAGTFVCAHPPSHNRFAVVFPQYAGRSMWYSAMTRALESLPQDPAFQVVVHHDIVDLDPSSPAFKALLAEVRAKRLAGAFLAAPMPALARALREAGPGLPLVRLAGEDDGLPAHRITFEPAGGLVLRILRERGRQRLAAIANLAQGAAFARDLLAAAREAGLVCREEWLHLVDPNSSATARGIVRLLASLPEGMRPDALYVADEHLATDATWGLHDAGLRVPEDMAVVCHGNSPYPPLVCMPVTCVGYDMAALMRLAVDELKRLAAGDGTKGVSTVRPVVLDMSGQDAVPADAPAGRGD